MDVSILELEVSNGEEEEGNVEEEEESEEGKSGLEGAEKAHGGEDEPSIMTNQHLFGSAFGTTDGLRQKTYPARKKPTA